MPDRRPMLDRAADRLADSNLDMWAVGVATALTVALVVLVAAGVIGG